jgi:hypothetical protein
MKLLPVLLAASLTACATTAADLRDREPLATYRTTHPSDQVVRCLTDHIRNYGQPSVIADAAETTLTFVDRNAAVLVWAIAADGSVRVWRLHGLVPYQEAAQRCL